MRTPLLALVVALGAVGVTACKKDAPPAVATPAATARGSDVAATATPTGPRKVAVEANIKGYTPGRITAAPGEQLVLVVTRTLEGACLEQISVAGGAPITLPLHTAVEIPVTAPASGELAFACGMDMFRGAILVES
jgi:plastocyanin domain-containing protein